MTGFWRSSDGGKQEAASRRVVLNGQESLLSQGWGFGFFKLVDFVGKRVVVSTLVLFQAASLLSPNRAILNHEYPIKFEDDCLS
jgi:hypothetical protein